MDETDILKSAIELEEAGISFYAKQAGEADNQYAKILFERMVGEEEGHRETLVKALDALENDSEIEFEAGRVPAPEVYPEYVEPLHGGYIDALTLALAMEEKTLEFYLEASEKTSNPALNKIYDYLVEFEEEHVRRLEQEIEFIQNTAGNSEL